MTAREASGPSAELDELMIVDSPLGGAQDRVTAAPADIPLDPSRMFRVKAMSRLFGLYALSRTLGFVREIGTAYLFGTSATADLLSASLVVSSVAFAAVTETVYAFSVRSLAGRNDADALAALTRFSVRVGLVITA